MVKLEPCRPRSTGEPISFDCPGGLRKPQVTAELEQVIAEIPRHGCVARCGTKGMGGVADT